jgi:hypothetical protein
MPWVRFDDHYPVNRKVDGLSDTAFRLHTSAIFWCARNLTDGVVPEDDLELVTARVRAPLRFATELVRRELWHVAGYQCSSEQCPPSGPDGWTIHDYFEYQPTKTKVMADKAANAERQRLFKDRKASQEGNAVSNGVTNALVTAPRPVPKELKKPSPPKGGQAEPDRFDEFWAAYPPRKNSSKADARKSYAKALAAGTDPEDIISGAKTYAADRAGQDQQFTTHAATWLNGKRWETQSLFVEPTHRWPWEN